MPASPDLDAERPVAEWTDAELSRAHQHPRMMNLHPDDTGAAMVLAHVIEEQRNRDAGEVPRVPTVWPKHLPAYKFPTD